MKTPTFEANAHATGYVVTISEPPPQDVPEATTVGGDAYIHSTPLEAQTLVGSSLAEASPSPPM